jgi:hypothetical protein
MRLCGEMCKNARIVRERIHSDRGELADSKKSARIAAAMSFRMRCRRGRNA